MKSSSHKDTEEKMYVYEVGYVLLPTITEEKLPEQVLAIRAILEEAQGMVISDEFPSLIPLAYSMEKAIDTGKVVCKEGYFGWIKFEMPASSVSAVDKKLSALESIVRFLIVKTFRDNVLFPNKVGANGANKVSKGDEDNSTENVNNEDGGGNNADNIDESIDALVIN